MMAGIQDFTYLNHGKETVRGTPVAPTRKLLADTTGVLDIEPSLNFHEGEQRGRRAMAYRVTQQGEDVTLKIRHDPTFDDIVLYFTQLKGGQTGTGAGADKTWSPTINMTQAAGVNNQESHTFDVGDDIQNWRVQYAMCKTFTQKAGLRGVTSFESEWFGQRALKVAKATPGDPASSPKIVSDHWTLKTAGTLAGLAGASVQMNVLRDHKFTFVTGLTAEDYQDGNLYFGQHQEGSFDGTLELTVDSTAYAISEFYDKWIAGTLDYVRLKNTSPIGLGGSFPSLQWDMAILWSKVQPIAEEKNGINRYKVAGRVVDDGTNPILTPVLVSSLAAIP